MLFEVDRVDGRGRFYFGVEVATQVNKMSNKMSMIDILRESFDHEKQEDAHDDYRFVKQSIAEKIPSNSDRQAGARRFIGSPIAELG